MGSKSGIAGSEVAYNAEISRRVAELRREAGSVRLVDLAVAAGVSQQMLHAYETGRSRWPVYRLRLIADFFDVDLAELMPEIGRGADKRKARVRLERKREAQGLYVGRLFQEREG